MGRAEREEKRGRASVDAGRRLTEHSSGDRQSLVLPSGLQFFVPKKPGVYVIDVIPYKTGPSLKRFIKNYVDPGDWYYERTYFNHQRIGVNQDAYVCSAKTFGKSCPICEFRIAKGNSPAKADADLVKALKWKERQLFLVWDHAEKHKGVQLFEYSNWAFGKNLDSKINNASEKKKPKLRRFADPDEGFTLRLIAEEVATGDGGKYLNITVDEFQERDDPIPDEILNHGYNLDDMVREVSYPEMKKIFMQVEDEEEIEAASKNKNGDDEDEDKPAVSARRSKPDDDEDPPPRTTKKPAADEDDDPPPARSKKPAADDDEPPAKPAKKEDPPASTSFKKGQTVTFEYKDKEHEGTIVGVDENREIVQVAVEGREKPYILDFTEVKVQKTVTKKPPADEDDDAPPRPAKKEPPKEEPKPTAKKPSSWDDDDDPPAKPAAKKPAADDDDDPPFRPKQQPKPAAQDEDDDPPPRRTARK